MNRLSKPLAMLLVPGVVCAQQAAKPTSRRAEPSQAKPAFTELFDGKTLTGWTTKGGRYDGNAEWSIEDGAIVGRQGMDAKGRRRGGGLIYTEGYYESFLLTLETKIDYPFDSGIFLHMVPRKVNKKGMQVTLDYRPNGEVGGIYADGWLQHNAKAKAAFRKDQWNRVTVLCSGKTPRVQVWLNDAKITDFTRKDNKGYAASGRIGLQVHGGRDDPGTARFRNIRIRELPHFDHADFDVDKTGQLTAKDGTSWTDLLADGKLDAWESVGAKDGHAIADGVLTFVKKGGGGYLRTKDDFEDFRLRMDFKVGFMANSGVFLRAARDKSNPAYSGCEIQILDDFNWEKVTKSKLKPYQFTGGLYGSVPAGVHALHEVGRWNTYDITYKGSRLRVELNGRVLYDVDTHEVPGKSFRKRAKRGFIGLQRHAPAQVKSGGYAWFRNMFVKKL